LGNSTPGASVLRNLSPSNYLINHNCKVGSIGNSPQDALFMIPQFSSAGKKIIFGAETTICVYDRPGQI
jgi:hypothetical protein